MRKIALVVREWRLAEWLITIAFAAAAQAAMGVTIGAPVLLGLNSNSALDEISGLVESRANANTLWVHNDSGDAARFYAMSRQGALLGTFPLVGIAARDWEDIAIGPKPGGGNYLYLGDIGDNNAVRSSITVHRTIEPLTNTGTTIPVGGYTSLNLQYPGGPRDAESLFVDPLSGDMFVITKRTAIPEIYSVPTSAFDTPRQTVMMTALGNVGGLLRSPTAADISPDGRFILIRNTSSTGYLFERENGQSVADALRGIAILVALGAESQGEAIGWATDGKSFYTTSEFSGGSTAPIYSYAFAAPATFLAGDYNDDHRVDAADYTVWRNQMGANIALPNEDDTPGAVTIEDYEVWLANFGESLNGGDAAAGVPEPGSWLLVVLGMATLAARRFSRQFEHVTPGSRSPRAACPGVCTSRSIRGGRVARAWSSRRGPLRSSLPRARRRVGRAFVRQ